LSPCVQELCIIESQLKITQNYYKSSMRTYAVSCLTSKLHILTFHTDKSEYVISQEWADVVRSFKVGCLAKWS